jgi:predicted esterase
VGLPNIIIGGFSGGAIVSLEITMANVLPVMGFVGLCLELKLLSILHQ